MIGSEMKEGRTYRVLSALSLYREPPRDSQEISGLSRIRDVQSPTLTVLEIHRTRGPAVWFRVRLKSGAVGWVGSLDIALAAVEEVK